MDSFFVGDLVKVDPSVGFGGPKCVWTRARIVEVKGNYVYVQILSRHKVIEKFPIKFLKHWKSAENNYSQIIAKREK